MPPHAACQRIADECMEVVRKLSRITNLDRAALPLHQPPGSLTTNGLRPSLDRFLGKAGTKILREAPGIGSGAGFIPLIGTLAQVAEQAGAAM